MGSRMEGSNPLWRAIAYRNEKFRIQLEFVWEPLTRWTESTIIHLSGVWLDIEFATTRLATASRSLSEASQLFGVPIGRKYIQRLAVFRAADKFAELYGHRALRLHPLKGNRAGQYAMTLTGNYRLIIERTSEDEVRVLVVEDYHGD